MRFWQIKQFKSYLVANDWGGSSWGGSLLEYDYQKPSESKATTEGSGESTSMALTTTTVGPQIVSRPSLVPYCPASFLGGGANLKSVGVLGYMETPKKLLKSFEGMVNFDWCYGNFLTKFFVGKGNKMVKYILSGFAGGCI